jgi:lipopolysaccharide/colanic/teichoic acid biosynthesis glycosyltransferase
MHVHTDTVGHRNYFTSLIKSAAPMTKLDTGRDPRLYPFARILRLLAIDELPQLINVLKGDMSIIGPRPCIPYEYQEFSRWHRQRVNAVPGLTGLWQVSGKNHTSFAQMMRLDISYARKRNVFLDLAIVIKTLPAIAVQAMDGLSKRVKPSRGKGETAPA